MKRGLWVWGFRRVLGRREKGVGGGVEEIEWRLVKEEEERGDRLAAAAVAMVERERERDEGWAMNSQSGSRWLCCI